MDEHELQHLARQLRQPHGEAAEKVGDFMNEGNLLINQYTIEALSLVAGDRVLEIGMGNGHFVKDILESANDIYYTGCDFSEKMIVAAQIRNKKYVDNHSAEFHLGNASQLPLHDAACTKAFSVNTIYFWDNVKLVLDEISRILVPGGKLFLALRPKKFMKDYPFVKYGFNLFEKEDVIELLAKNGFVNPHAHEIIEPDIEFDGSALKVATLIVSGEKPQ